MMKVINLYTRAPITALSVPIRGTAMGLHLHVKDIFKCMCQKAVIDEVLKDGSLVRLDMANYNTNNEPVIEEAIVEEVITPPVVDEVPPVETEDEEVTDPVVDEVPPVEVVTEATKVFVKEEKAKIEIKNKNNNGYRIK